MGNILSQDQYLYTSRWPKEAVDILISTLSDQASYGEWDYPYNMDTGVFHAKASLRKSVGILYYDAEIMQAIEMLNERYWVWKRFSNHPNTLINKHSNRAYAKPEVWSSLVQEDERVKWYGYEGENSYAELETIFDNPWTGKEDYVQLSQVDALKNLPGTLDDVELEPIPRAPSPGYDPTLLVEPSPVRRTTAQLNLAERLTPSPFGTPTSVEIISKAEYDSGRNSKYKKKLNFVPDSPISSASSTNGHGRPPSGPGESSFSMIRAKFNRRG